MTFFFPKGRCKQFYKGPEKSDSFKQVLTLPADKGNVTVLISGVATPGPVRACALVVFFQDPPCFNYNYVYSP